MQGVRAAKPEQGELNSSAWDVYVGLAQGMITLLDHIKFKHKSAEPHKIPKIYKAEPFPAHLKIQPKKHRSKHHPRIQSYHNAIDRSSHTLYRCLDSTLRNNHDIYHTRCLPDFVTNKNSNLSPLAQFVLSSNLNHHKRNRRCLSQPHTTLPRRLEQSLERKLASLITTSDY